MPGEFDSVAPGVDEFKGVPGVVGVAGAERTIPPSVATLLIGVVGS